MINKNTRKGWTVFELENIMSHPDWMCSNETRKRCKKKNACIVWGHARLITIFPKRKCREVCVKDTREVVFD